MFSRTVGTVTFHFEPLIVYGIFLSFILIFYLIRAILLESKCRRLFREVMNGRYDLVIQNGKKLLKIYQKHHKKLPTKALARKIEELNLALSISCFSICDDEQFLEHVQALNQYVVLKEFWLALFYLRKDDFDTAKTHYDRIIWDDSTYVNRIFLEAYLSYKQRDFSVAKEKMTEICGSITHLVLKKMANEVLDGGQGG